MESPAFCRQEKAGSVPGVRQGQRVLRAVCVCADGSAGTPWPLTKYQFAR